MFTLPPSHSPRHPAGSSAASATVLRPSADVRMLAQQQMRLLSGMTRLLSRLLHSLLWDALGISQRRRAQALLARLEHDLQLTHLLTQRPPVHKTKIVLADGCNGHDRRRSPQE